jgi:quinol monooxygenase YgiN
MIVIAGYFRAPAATMREFAPLVRDYAALIRQEPGCLEFTASVDVDDPEKVRVFEIYADRAAFDAHSRSPHLAAWKETRQRLGVTERVINLYQVSSVEKA